MLILKNINEKTSGKEIKVNIMGEDISVRIRPLSVDIINSLRKRHRDEKKLNDALIDHVLESFDGIGDEKGDLLEVNLENKKRVMNIAGVDGRQGAADIIFNEAKKLALEIKEEEIKN